MFNILTLRCSFIKLNEGFDLYEVYLYGLYQSDQVQCRHLIPALNFGQPRDNTRPHARLPVIFLCMVALMTSQLKVAVICRLRRSLMCLLYFWTCYPWVFVKPGTGRRPVDWCRN